MLIPSEPQQCGRLGLKKEKKKLQQILGKTGGHECLLVSLLCYIFVLAVVAFTEQ